MIVSGGLVLQPNSDIARYHGREETIELQRSDIHYRQSQSGGSVATREGKDRGGNSRDITLRADSDR